MASFRKRSQVALTANEAGNSARSGAAEQEVADASQAKRSRLACDATEQRAGSGGQLGSPLRRQQLPLHTDASVGDPAPVERYLLMPRRQAQTRLRRAAIIPLPGRS